MGEGQELKSAAIEQKSGFLAHNSRQGAARKDCCNVLERPYIPFRYLSEIPILVHLRIGCS